MFQMTRKKAKAMGDVLLLLAIATGVAILFIGASTLPPPRFEPLGSAAMPRILGIALLLLSLPVAYEAIRDLLVSDDLEEKAAIKLPFGGALVFVALVIYVAALDFGKMPFIPTTTIFIAAAGMAIDRVSLRVLAIYGGLGLVLASALSYVFTNFLYVQLG